MSHLKVGNFTQAATAIAVEVNCGFAPDKVKIVNLTDGDYEEWYKGMTDGHGIISLAGTAAQLVRTAVTVNGITPSGDAAADTFKGFTFGLNTGINIAAKVYYWEAELQD
jgi:hypothetical protein